MNGKPPWLVPFNSGQKPAEFVRAGVEPRSCQILFGFGILPVNALKKRLAVVINDYAEINRRVSQSGTTKVDDAVDAFPSPIEHDVVRRQIGIYHFELVLEILPIAQI